jgi:hypothetical protein
MADERMVQELQDLGREFGCPPGMRVTVWLRDRLQQLTKAEDACRRYVDGGLYSPGHAMDEVRDALGLRA